MRRVALTLVFALWVPLVTACTDSQLARFFAAKTAVEATEDPADDAALRTALDTYGAQKAAATAGRPCPEWYDTAIEAGWTPEEWPTVARIMRAESNCLPTADNGSSTARGLMQILAMWTDDCGITYEQLHDPALNLRCARHIQHVGGWDDWVTW